MTSITWSTRPEFDARTTYPIHRAGRESSWRFIVLAGPITGTEVHYWHGRSMPCLTASGNRCAPCESPEGNLPRWRGYLPVWYPGNQAKYILELTPPCVEAIEKYETHHETLRGARIQLHRHKGRANGRLTTAISRSEFATSDLPATFNVAKALERIWDIDRIVAKNSGTEPTWRPTDDDQEQPQT